MNASTTLKKFGLEQAFHYIYRDPEKNMLRIMDWADKFAGDEFVSQRKIIREVITNPEHPYYSYVRRLFTDVDPNVTRTLAVNFFINAGHKENLERLHKELLNKDWFMTLLDLEEYIAVKDRMLEDYRDEEKWKRMMLTNIAKSGFFSSDRTIREYNEDIWKLS